jgi:hypothetical protein
MTHPSEVEEVMRSARQEPNWKTAVIEGESWEGTTEEKMSRSTYDSCHHDAS